VDKEALFTPRIEQDKVELPGVGTVIVRGLTRWELLTAGKVADKGPLYMERAMLAFAMVDPKLTEDEVARWQKASPGAEMMPVIQKINELSGVTQGASKSDLPSDGDEP